MTARRIRQVVLGGAMTLAMLAAGAFAGAAPAQAAPGPPSAPEYWFDQWQIPTLWDAGVRGQGVVIAEIDTGVNAQLDALAGKVLSGKDFGAPGNGQIDRETDEFGHGTAMASIMVGAPSTLGITGIAPDAKILPIAVPLTGTSDAASDDHLAAAIRWAVDHGAKVISMSLGGARHADTDSHPCPTDEQSAIYYAMNKGAVVLAAGGNRGESDNAVEEPGVCLGVVAVGAVDQNEVVAGFSSRHPYLSLAAPGVNIASLSRIPGAAYHGDGTSQATAITSAVVALVWSKYPKLTGRQVIARILATLSKVSALRTPELGYGVLDGYRAVTATVSPTAPNPIYDAAAPFQARDAAVAKAAVAAPPRPSPVVAGIQSTGTFSVGPSNRLLTTGVVIGSAIALAGLLGLLVLLVIGLRRRGSGAPAPVSVPPPAEPDATGAVWHEIPMQNLPELPRQLPERPRPSPHPGASRRDW
ncbi:MAG: S8 family serine peptidase [Jatrophihabitantaceae bacterium]